MRKFTVNKIYIASTSTQNIQHNCTALYWELSKARLGFGTKEAWPNEYKGEELHILLAAVGYVLSLKSFAYFDGRGP
jgi:hypothetical protein